MAVIFALQKWHLVTPNTAAFLFYILTVYNPVPKIFFIHILLLLKSLSGPGCVNYSLCSWIRVEPLLK